MRLGYILRPFHSPFSPSRARTSYPPPSLYNGKLLHETGRTKLQRPFPVHPVYQTNSVAHLVTHPQASTSWTHEANMPAQGAPTPTTSLAWMLVVAGRRAETEEPVGMAICLVRAIPRRCSSGSRAVLPGRTSGPRSWRRGGGASLVLLDRTSRPRSWCCEAAAIFALLSVTLTGGLFLYPERFPQPAVPSGAKLAVDSHNRLSP